MKKINIMLTILVGALMLFGSIVAVNAYRGDFTQVGPNYSEDRHELMENAFENNDYNTWYELMTQDGRHPRVLDVITEENFKEFAQIHELKENGDFEKAQELKEGLGLGMRNHNGQGRHMGKGMKQNSCSFRN